VRRDQIQTIVILGAGRLGTHLAVALARQGLDILQVYNRTPSRGQSLALKTGACHTSDLRQIIPTADLYILTVSDTAVAEIAGQINLERKLVVHTSGSLDMSVLSPVSENIGVLYPLQTFSQHRRISFRSIPICVEAGSARDGKRLAILAGKLSQRVVFLDSGHRRMLHLGAVFVSNFTNYLYAVTEDMLRHQQIPFDLLGPLILHTARNVGHGDLFSSQTGPAARGDLPVLEKHYDLLTGYPEHLEIYKLITKNIIKTMKKNGKL
jgi:predicted short-subunit dehydrogenase-like oxidoreductase (DUF2520 family)